MYPLSYRLFTFTNSEIAYASQTLQRIDTAALAAATNGYTEEQLRRMDEDLNGFAKEFLKKGVQYRLALQLDAEKSGLTRGSALYTLLDSVYGRLKELLEMPLYGEGSVSELASEYGISIPETPCETGWDLATEFVAAHYAGSENFDLRGPEVTALLRLASLILKNVPAQAIEEAVSLPEVFSGETLVNAKALARSVFGRVNPGEVFIAALVSDLVYGFTSDDALDDNNGVIEGYGSTNRLAALAQSIAACLKRLATVIGNFFSFFVR
jgi:hypothetical protein